MVLGGFVADDRLRALNLWLLAQLTGTPLSLWSVPSALAWSCFLVLITLVVKSINVEHPHDHPGLGILLISGLVGAPAGLLMLFHFVPHRSTRSKWLLVVLLTLLIWGVLFTLGRIFKYCPVLHFRNSSCRQNWRHLASTVPDRPDLVWHRIDQCQGLFATKSNQGYGVVAVTIDGLARSRSGKQRYGLAPIGHRGPMTPHREQWGVPGSTA